VTYITESGWCCVAARRPSRESASRDPSLGSSGGFLLPCKGFHRQALTRQRGSMSALGARWAVGERI
jgi:hypothetical protein